MDETKEWVDKYKIPRLVMKRQLWKRKMIEKIQRETAKFAKQLAGGKDKA